MRETWSQPWAQRERWFHSAARVVGASSREIRVRSTAIRAPLVRERMVESMSSVSMEPCIRVRASRSVRQKPLEPPKTPKPCRRVRPGWLTA
ncbi:hypothetical protein SAZ_31810 [Streptomyces noursei ZPM]|nr:hypothetical protein SAZ_31810 [Streptomyces noursei ZPM]